MKLLSRLFLACLVAFSGAFFSALTPANSAESQQAQVFYAYIKELYYAKKIDTLARYWISTTRIPMANLKGQAAVYELQKLKTGYVYKPKINSQVMQGKRCLMKGTAIAQDLGRTFPCTVDLVMIFEDGMWRIQYYTWSATINQ